VIANSHSRLIRGCIIYLFSIFAQVNITNPTSWLVKFDVLSCYIHIQVNITKPKFTKWRLAGGFVEVTDKEISEIKINSVPKNTKNLCKNTKTIIRLRLGDYRGIFTSTSSRWIFIIYRPGARRIRRNITRSDEISSLRVMFRRIPRAEGL
jgi:mRNA-degrading endonuclease RelE of RelBE toxin-antitoxin system